jgi:anti-sigma-K factor RskA
MSVLTEEDCALAGEFALGLLDSADAALANARCAVDAEFAAEVEAWRERFLPMLGNVSNDPPAGAWNKINAAIDRAETAAAPANDNKALRLWKGLTALSGTAAAALAIMLFTQPANQQGGTPIIAGNNQAAGQKMVAALQSETGPSIATASYNPASGELLITPVSMDTGDLYPEIWVIPADGKAHSLGVIARKGASRHNVDPKMRQYLASGATIAITPEPAGGAPGGKATGPVMASGKITLI